MMVAIGDRHSELVVFEDAANFGCFLNEETLFLYSGLFGFKLLPKLLQRSKQASFYCF